MNGGSSTAAAERATRDLTLLAAARLRIGSRRLRALAAGDASSVREWVQSEVAVRLAEARRDARIDAATLTKLDAQIVALGDAAFPAALRDLTDPPAFLVVRGRLPSTGIAVIGARDASPRACAWAGELVAALPYPVVSGLARGIDAAAHRAALQLRRPQVAYIGSGIARPTPSEHGELADAIVAAGGAVASEYLPDAAVTRWSLVRRDRLQAAHARAVLLVESAADGGAMHTVAAARRLGRPVFALACDASGNRAAIAAGAAPVPWDVAGAAERIAGAMSGMPFSPFDLDKARQLTGDDLDALPFGVIVVDRGGVIQEYNAYEREMAHMGTRDLIGRNFFRDVAPCTAIQDFEGRFTAFLDSDATSIEPFQFMFPFARGDQRVTVIFVRVSNTSDRATICVIRSEA